MQVNQANDRDVPADKGFEYGTASRHYLATPATGVPLRIRGAEGAVVREFSDEACPMARTAA